MGNLTFGEQVKIILGRKGMTIKELASIIEERTGKKMSRQNLTQRLGRDNFQEQDMRMIASILECPFHLSIMDPEEMENGMEDLKKELKAVDMIDGELYQMQEDEEPVNEEAKEESLQEAEETESEKQEEPHEIRRGGTIFLRRQGDPMPEPETEKVEKEEKPEKPEKTENLTFEPIIKRNDEEENREVGDLNPYTRREYQSNSVRMHPTRLGYVQVYNRKDHKWTDMTEWAFLGYQEREKIRLGEDYEPPIYLD